MTDLEIIAQIADEIQVPIHRMTLEELNKDPNKQGIRGYVLDEHNNIIALRLCNTICKNESLLANLKHLHTLYVRFNGFESFAFLKELPLLKELHLSAPYLDDFSFLSELHNLTCLGLNNNHISDLSCISELKNLKSLNIRNNKISDISVLRELINLNSLYLSNNNITDFSVLKELKNLNSLDLSNNNITDFSVLKELTNLNSLYLRSNKITDFSVLRELINLNSLYLGYNKISDISVLRELINLNSLYLSNNRISDISVLRELINLNSLYLSYNKISDISVLRELINLNSLDLSYNKITDTSVLRELINLNSLYLNYNKISDISVLKELKNLNSLYLSNNKITDISILIELKNLNSLYISNNNINDFSVLRELKNLNSLDLSYNNITDISVLRELKNLNSLYLSNNKITDFSVLRELKNLNSLDLSSNNVTDISVLRELKNLNSLDLCSNNINDFSVLREFIGLTNLYISRNQISDVSFLVGAKNILTLATADFKLYSIPETIWNAGPQSIRRYLLKTAASSARLFEAKTLFVGEPEAGKTSLMRKLIDPEFKVPQKTQASTLGIDIVPDWTFALSGEYKENIFKAHFWDFGGQTIQYYIHQFFLTERSLYVLVLDDRRETGNLEYWFNIIRVLGGNKCPVLIVRNEKNITATTGFDQETWYRRYSEYLNLHFFSVNLADTTDGRLEVINKAIQKQLCTLSHIGEVLPSGWVKIREELAELAPKNHITLEQMCELCRKHGITGEVDTLQLCSYLTDLGVIQHFANDSELSNVVFVNSQWLTNAVYQILSDKTLEEKKGKFTKEWLFNKWGEKYSFSEKNNLLLLMQKQEFDLIYPLEGDEKGYIAPRLLPDVAPDAAHKWNHSNLSFRYRYPFMPEGIISRLIVRLYEHIAEDANGGLVWANGVILEQNGCRALVKKDRDRSGVPIIDIDVQGQEYNSREFLKLIRETLDILHHKSFKNAARDLLLPCCCDTCRKSIEPSWFEMSRIKKFLDAGKYDILCENGEFKEVNIADILSNIISIDNSLIMQHRSFLETFETGLKTNRLADDEIIRFIMNLTEEQRIKLYNRSRDREIQKTTIFVSYSHKDSKWLETVQRYLNPLKNMGYSVELWDDQKLKAGEKWKEEIKRALDKAKVGLCLISMNFLNSDFIMKHELPELLKNAESKGTRILFLHVERSTAHLDPRISCFQHVNDPKKPLQKMIPEEQQDTLINLAEIVTGMIQDNKEMVENF